MNTKSFFVVPLFLIICICSPLAMAQTSTWTGAGTDDLWFNNDNWDTAAPNGITVDVIVDSPSPTIINGNVNINSLTVGANGVITLNSGFNLDFGGTAGTTLTNMGVITSAFNTDIQLVNTVNNSGIINAGDDLELNGNAMLTGGGIINMVTATDINGSGILTNVDNTLQGQGDIGINLIGFVNQAGGLVNANVSGANLIVDPSNADGAVNMGTMQASSGGSLVLTGSGGGTFDNTGGLIQALDGSFVVLTSGASVTGGTFSTSGTGIVAAAAGQNVFVTDITNTGNIVVANNTDFGVLGTINNQGDILVNSSASLTDIELQGDTMFTGGGTITLDSLVTTTFARINGSGTFTNVDNTVQGFGDIGANSVGIVNQAGGLFDANVASEVLVLDPSAALGLTNMGTMQASNGGALRLTGSGTGTFDNTGGLIQALDGSLVQLTASANVIGGTFSTTGTGIVEVADGQNVFFTDITNTGNMIGRNNTDFGVFGTINNQGDISMISTASLTDIELQGDTMFTGGGTVTLESVASTTLSRITGSGTFTNVDNTVQGFGDIGTNSIGIDNQSGGLFDANVAGEVLVVDPNAGTGLTNTGTMQASNGGILSLTGSGTGSFNNTNGLIQALDGSIVDLRSAANITGGTLDTDGTGTFSVAAGQTARLNDLSNNGNLTTQNNADLTLFGLINNSGSITINSTASTTDILIAAGGATLDGGGTVTLNSAAGSTLSRFAGGDTLTIVNQTINGNGSIGSNAVTIDNQAGGLIDANVNGEAIFVDPAAAGGLTNTGTMQASNGGNLILTGGSGGEFNNAGGLIQALDGSVVTLTSNANISGGDLSSTGSGQFVVNSGFTATLNNLSTSANIATFNNADLSVGGTINNSGSITVDATASTTDIIVNAGGATFTGGGTLTLGSSTGSNLARVVGSGTTLTNANHTINGFGQLGANSVVIDNQLGGVIDANVNGMTLLIDPSVHNLTNTGTLRASNGGVLQINVVGPWNNDGTLDAGVGSSIEFVGSGLTTNSTTSSVIGNGMIVGDSFEFSGLISPGASAGALTIEEMTTVANEGVLLMSDSDLFIEIGGTLAGTEYDQLIVNGTLGLLDGELSVALINGFTPDETDQFTIATINPTSTEDLFFGTFGNGSIVSFPGGTFDIVYNTDSVVLTNFQAAAIPEPATLSVIGTLGFLMLGRRRRRH